MFRSMIKVLFYSIIIIVFITFGPSSILLDIEPEHHNFPLPKSFSGGLTLNDKLSFAEKLFKNHITGPESIAQFNNNIFVSSEEGFIYKIEGQKLKPIIRLINNECLEPWNSSVCGRPLGLKFDSNGTLYVVEPFYGIYSIANILTQNPIANKIFDIKQTESLGTTSKFLDDLAIDENGGENGGPVLYMSDVSSKYDVTQVMLLVGASDRGRLIKYDINAKTVETLVEGILFPNGVEITDDKTAILFAECMSRRIFKHYIKGSKKGQTEILASNLPAEPDNIRRSATKAETYWVAFGIARNESNPISLDALQGRPLVRKFILRLLHLVGSGVEFLGDILSSDVIKEFGYQTKSGLVMIKGVEGGHGLVAEMDKDGNIIQSLHSPDGSVSQISEAKEVRVNQKETILYLGSFSNKYLGKINLINRV